MHRIQGVQLQLVTWPLLGACQPQALTEWGSYRSQSKCKKSPQLACPFCSGPVDQAAKGKAKAKAKPTADALGDTATLRVTEKFYARAEDLYECFTNPMRVQAYLQSPCKARFASGIGICQEVEISLRVKINSNCILGFWTHEAKDASE